MSWLPENRLSYGPARSRRWPPLCAKNRRRWMKSCPRRCAGLSTDVFKRSPEQRYESTRDLYQELRNLRDHLSEAHSSGALAPVVAPAKRRRWKLPALCAACILFAGLLVYVLNPSGQNIGNYRYTPFATDTSGKAIWSPDGKAVAYARKVNGTYQVFLRYLQLPVPVAADP